MPRGLPKPHLIVSCTRNFYAIAPQELAESSHCLQRRAWAWKETILEYAKHGKSKLVLEAYGQLNQHNFKSNGYIFVSVIKSCASQGAYLQGKLIHAQVVDCGLESTVFVGSSLINFYFKLGSPEDGQSVFDGLQQYDIVIWNAMIAGYAQHGHVNKMLELFLQLQMDDLEPNIATWNAVIGGCAHNKLNEEALRLFNQMVHEGCLPEDITFASILNACTNIEAENLGKLLHVQLLENGLSADVFLGNTLINLYVKCGNLQHARLVFQRLPQQDCVTWNALISGYALHGNCSEALELFHDMQKKGQSPDLVTWNALLTGHVQHGPIEKVLLLFQQMEEQGRKPDSVTFVNVLKACSLMAAFKKGKLIHAYLLETDSTSDLFVCNALIDMYAKSGNLNDAHKVFNMLPKRNLVTWNSLLSANSAHNQFKAMFECFGNMQSEGFQPDEVTLLCILSACARGGCVDPGGSHFISILKAHGISPKPEQYSCVVDLLGRNGFLHEAESLLDITSMRGHLQAWSSLLSHCRMYGDVHLGRRCFDHILSLDDQYTSGYELMSALYADMGMWESVGQIQDLQRRAEEAERSKLCMKTKAL